MEQKLDYFDVINYLSQKHVDQNLIGAFVDFFCVMTELGLINDYIRQKKCNVGSLKSLEYDDWPKTTRLELATFFLTFNLYAKSLKTLENKLGLVIKYKEGLAVVGKHNSYPDPQDVSAVCSVRGKELLQSIRKYDNVSYFINKRSKIFHKLNSEVNDNLLILSNNLNKINYREISGKGLIDELELTLEKNLKSINELGVLVAHVIKYIDV